MNLDASFFTALADVPPLPTLPPIPRTDGSSQTVRIPADFIIRPDGYFNPIAWSGAKLFNTPAVLSALKAKVVSGLVRGSRVISELGSNLNGSGLETGSGVSAVRTTLETEVGELERVRSWESVISDYLEGYDPAYIAQKVNAGYTLTVVDRSGGYGKLVVLTPPVVAGEVFPQFYFIEEYVTKNFARDCGAGKTLKVHALFPGEETTVTIKTFQETKTTNSRTDNMVDSASQESSQELESIIERESSKNISTTMGGGIRTNASLNFSIPKVGTGTAGIDKNFNASRTRTTNSRNLSKAISKSVSKSNSSRQITINTSTQESTTQSEEIAIVRKFSNVNKSRVLNLAFRELLQEYITITY
ncbi:MAG: hypothetical protein EAZ92_00825, partial [Candidatus Kapaibacterium sp.]